METNKEKVIELLRYAYLWGRDNGQDRSEKDFNDFLIVKEKVIDQLYSAGEEVSDERGVVELAVAEIAGNGKFELAEQLRQVYDRLINDLAKLTRPTVSEEEIRRIRTALSLLNSMIIGGEIHTDASKRLLAKAMSTVQKLLNR